MQSWDEDLQPMFPSEDDYDKSGRLPDDEEEPVMRPPRKRFGQPNRSGTSQNQPAFGQGYPGSNQGQPSQPAAHHQPRVRLSRDGNGEEVLEGISSEDLHAGAAPAPKKSRRFGRKKAAKVAPAPAPTPAPMPAMRQATPHYVTSGDPFTNQNSAPAVQSMPLAAQPEAPAEYTEANSMAKPAAKHSAHAKSNAGLVLCTTIMLAAAFVACVCAGIIIGMHFNTNGTAANNSTSGSAEQAESAAVVDPVIVEETADAEVTAQVDSLFIELNRWGTRTDITPGQEFVTGGLYLFPTGLYDNTQTTAEKLYTAFYALDLASLPSNTIAKNQMNISSEMAYLRDGELYDFLRVAQADAVADKYYQLYGEELVHQDVNEEGLCPGFAYDATRNIYYVGSGCGGAGVGGNLFYREKVTSDGDFAYLYLRAGSLAPEGAGATIYTDLAQSDTKTQFQTFSTSSEGESFVINSSNAKSFTPYRLVFRLGEDGNYHFAMTEKLAA